MINAATTIFAQMLDPHRIEFPNLGFGFNIDPTAFTVFGLDIQWYGIIITLGLVLAILYVFPRMKRFGIDSDRAIDAVIGGVLGGIVGARLYYVIFNWEDYSKGSFGATLKAVINTRNGGLAIYGGIIGAFVVGFIICKLRKVRILPMLDVTVLGLLIGQGIGRWGNFVNQEAFGTNTDLFCGMTGGTIQRTISNAVQIGGDMYNNGNPEMMWEKAVHPCFLYESLWCILGFVILAFISKKRRYDGQIFLMYMAWYGFERFFVEGLRTDSLMIGNIRVSQALSAVIFIASVIIQIVMFSRIKRDPESFVLYANTEESRMLIEESRRKAMGIKGADEDDNDEFFAEAEKKLNAAKDKVEDAVEAAEEKVEEATEAAKDKTEKAVEAVKDKAEETVDAVEDKAENIADKAVDEVKEAAETVEEAVEEKVAETADEVADKYDQLAEKHDERLSGGSGKGGHSKKKKHKKK